MEFRHQLARRYFRRLEERLIRGRQYPAIGMATAHFAINPSAPIVDHVTVWVLMLTSIHITAGICHFIIWLLSRSRK